MNTPNIRETQWASPVKTLTIERFQADASGTLRAWDTADDYLVRETVSVLDDWGTPRKGCTVAIIDDDFGALTTAITHLSMERSDLSSVHVISDSSLSREAIQANLQANLPANVTANASSVAPTAPAISDSIIDLPQGLQFDLVLMKVPKSIAAFESLLRQLQPRVTERSCILAAGMVKHLLPATQDMLEKNIGPVTRLHAVKKARLFKCIPDASLQQSKTQFPRTLRIDALNISIESDAGVFSASRADPASLFLIEHLPATITNSVSDKDTSAKLVMDLGCGSGLLGLAAGIRYPNCQLCFVDVSSVAVRNARRNVQQVLPGTDALFLHQHRLVPWAHDPVDLILCNPPFHQKHTVTLETSRQMFADARDIMRAGAALIVVANRHLPYDSMLQHLFGKQHIVAQNKKFRLYRATKRG